ncbi:hypothetical protein [Ruminiclostridium cellobioparum]|uniref:hypothetical protein n=1 Tax=Ruminiclostridium cellobioparum TaxID=29355 RepID=UPI0028A83B64|nr:hypothetical protein [Ruminiclostridium cellobioparum]
MKQPFLFKKDKMFGGALDFSFLLESPAGKYGFVRIKDGHFYVGDKRIRFYGFNIPFGSLCSSRQDAEIIAERLAKAGVNFVRLHAEDSREWAEGHLLIDYSKGNSRNLDPEHWDRLDYLFYCLKQRGIYLQLDLFCYRSFMPDDGLDYPDNMMKYFKQVNVFNRRLIDLQKEYATNYLTHLNPYTGLRYIDDAAVAIIQVMNEDGIFWYEGRDETGLPSYRKELDWRFNHYLLAKYGSRKALDAVWTKEDGTRCLLEDEDPELGTVRRLPHLEGTQMYCDWKANYRGMESPARYADYTEFLTGIQLDFSKEMRDHLISLGTKCPINISNHAQGAADIYSLDRYTDVIRIPQVAGSRYITISIWLKMTPGKPLLTVLLSLIWLQGLTMIGLQVSHLWPVSGIFFMERISEAMHCRWLPPMHVCRIGTEWYFMHTIMLTVWKSMTITSWMGHSICTTILPHGDRWDFARTCSSEGW